MPMVAFISFLRGSHKPFIRLKKPSKVVEIGCGSSTKVIQAALATNSTETHETAEHLCIEPYEHDWLDAYPGIRVIRQPLQSLDNDWSKELSEGDLLFIDSTHMIRPNDDVLFEYLKVIPTLSSGVYVHVHDIFSPRDYPAKWLVEDVRFWNEQYLLEATLMNTSRYQIIASLNFLFYQHRRALESACTLPLYAHGSVY